MIKTDYEDTNLSATKIHAMPATESAEMLLMYQHHVCALLSAASCYWIAAYRGKFGRETWRTKLMDDWKIVDTAFSGLQDPSTDEVVKQYWENASKSGMDPQANHAIRHAGKTRVHRLEDTVAIEEWEKHWMHKRLLTENVGERMVGAYNLGANAESYVLVDRAPGQPRFSEQDGKILLEALLEFPRVHYWVMLERGLIPPAQKSFSPRQREVLKHLMSPMAEKQIADELNISKGALHNYVTEIYKNLRVSSRYELMQCWINQVPTP